MIESFTDEVAEELLEDSTFMGLLKQSFKNFFQKASYDDSAWDGSAGRWDTPEAYCSSCLIDMNESGKKKTKDKCKLPVRHPGSSAINKGALRALATGHGIPALQGVPAELKRKAARFAVRHWKPAFGKPAPDNLQRIAKGGGQKVVLIKDLDGDTWFFGVYTNKFLDREKEILSEASHQEYVDWARRVGFEPPVTVFHQPRIPGDFWVKIFEQYEDDGQKLNRIVSKIYEGFSFATVKRIMVVNGFVVVAAKVHPDMLDVADRLAQEADLRMSHGFVSKDVKERVFNVYRSFEMTVLPGHRAANPFTVGTFLKDASMDEQLKMNDEDRAWFEGKYGPEKAAVLLEAMETGLAEWGQKLEGVIDFKDFEDANMGEDKQEPTQEEEKVQPKQDLPEQKQEGAEEEEEEEEEGMAKAVAAELAKLLKPQEMYKAIEAIYSQVEELSTKVTALEDLTERVEKVEKSTDERVASELISPDWSKFYQATSAPDNVMGEEEKAEVSPPQAPKTKKGKQANALQIGLWDVLEQT